MKIEDMRQWLTANGWIEAPDGTWGYPNSTCRYVSTETAYHIGQLIVEMNAEEEPA